LGAPRTPDGQASTARRRPSARFRSAGLPRLAVFIDPVSRGPPFARVTRYGARSSGPDDEPARPAQPSGHERSEYHQQPGHYETRKQERLAEGKLRHYRDPRGRLSTGGLGLREMENRPVLRSQKADLFRLVETAALDPREFKWETVAGIDAGTTVDQLTHRPTNYYFRFNVVQQGHHTTFSPGGEAAIETQFPGSWPGQVMYFTYWLEYLKRELAAPPLWEQLAGGEPLLEIASLPSSAPDTPFSEPERRAILLQFVEVRAYVSRELPPENMAAIAGRLDDLEAAVTTQGRQTWMAFAVGVFVTLAWGGLMAPEQARAILQIIAGAFLPLLRG
jgi:hypothetical protein